MFLTYFRTKDGLQLYRYAVLSGQMRMRMRMRMVWLAMFLWVWDIPVKMVLKSVMCLLLMSFSCSTFVSLLQEINSNTDETGNNNHISNNVYSYVYRENQCTG